MGVEVALVLPAGGMDRHVHGHAETLAKVESELAHCIPHLLTACLVREGDRDHSGSGGVLSPLRSLGCGP
jgi:hypothetical protein